MTPMTTAILRILLFVVPKLKSFAPLPKPQPYVPVNTWKLIYPPTWDMTVLWPSKPGSTLSHLSTLRTPIYGPSHTWSKQLETKFESSTTLTSLMLYGAMSTSTKPVPQPHPTWLPRNKSSPFVFISMTTEPPLGGPVSFPIVSVSTQTACCRGSTKQVPRRAS